MWSRLEMHILKWFSLLQVATDELWWRKLQLCRNVQNKHISLEREHSMKPSGCQKCSASISDPFKGSVDVCLRMILIETWSAHTERDKGWQWLFPSRTFAKVQHILFSQAHQLCPNLFKMSILWKYLVGKMKIWPLRVSSFSSDLAAAQRHLWSPNN